MFKLLPILFLFSFPVFSQEKPNPLSEKSDIGVLYKMTIGTVNIKHLKTNKPEAQAEVMELIKSERQPQALCFRTSAVASVIENFKSDCDTAHVAQTDEHILLAGACHNTLTTLQLNYKNPAKLDGIMTWKSKNKEFEFESEANITFESMNKMCL